MKIVPILLACSLLSVAAVALAADDDRGERQQQRQQRAEAHFDATDSNHDGRISQSEWQAERLRTSNEHFLKLDANRDGNLSREELVAAKALQAGRRGGAMRERLRALDTDGDQQLSRAELGDKHPKLAADFDRFDANRDGKLSREEMRAGHEARRSESKR